MLILRNQIALLVTVLLSAVCSSCASAPEVREDTRTVADASLFDQLNQSCRLHPVLVMADMGRKCGYAPSAEVRALISQIVLKHDVEQQITDVYCSQNDANQDLVPAEVLFPLIDILLKVEATHGRDTSALRMKLWEHWRQVFPFEMDVCYFPRLSSYENEIRS